ncbi:MAG: hypothetical protein AB7G23_19105 [Vicinamibacterales bacterium]
MKPFHKKTIVRIDGSAQWLLARDPDSGELVATCPGLNLTAVGDTMAQLVEGIEQSICLLLESLLAHGELEAFLLRNGWTLMNGAPAPGQKRVRFDLPFEIQKVGSQELVHAH